MQVGNSGTNEIVQVGSFKVNVAFALLLIAVTLYFMWWGIDYTNGNNIFIFILATLFGIFMAFNIGGNDVANSFGTSVGAGTLTIPQALGVAAIFEVSGAVIAGGEVTDTIRKGIVDLSAVHIEPMQFVFIMMSSLVAAALWLLFATKKGWPVSTTHSIIGGIVGASVTLGFMIGGSDTGLSLVKWSQIGDIAISWVLSPLLGGVVSYALFYQIKKYILSYNDSAQQLLTKLNKAKRLARIEDKKAFERLSDIQKLSYTGSLARDAQVFTEDSISADDLETNYYRTLYDLEQEKYKLQAFKALQTWVPLVAALGGMIIAAMLLFKGLKNLHLGFSALTNFLIMGMIGAIIWMATFIYAKTLKSGQNLDKATFIMFSWMQVFTASGFAFSHGSNDIANAIGPFAAIMDVLRTQSMQDQAAVPMISMVTFGIALIVGLWFIGKEVIQTVGKNLAEMHPASGFSAELSAAGVVMIASFMGLPVSSTHILVGAVLGIGLVNHNANWGLMKPIALAWVITLPAAAIIASLSFILFTTVL
ncbi:inorganic phosphate transporter [Psychrobacter pygoscelis]|uniref:inorganic phosphate transporter n=1 Tax=Psychrobacter pygoscelis TaxID=2488563 RepID=UPI00103BD102|nr:inorganic phosphate transporter [Psychrobacter pygoscelis]